MHLLLFLFDPRGRLGRRGFLAGAAFWLVAVAAGFWLVLRAPRFEAAHLAALLVVATLSGTALQIRRFHDRDRSGWRVALFVALALLSVLLPIVVVPFCVLCVEHLVELGLVAGTPGPNRYGPPPRAPAGGTPLASIRS